MPETQDTPIIRRSAVSAELRKKKGSVPFSRSQLYGNADYNVSNGGAYIQGEQGFFKQKNSDNAKIFR